MGCGEADNVKNLHDYQEQDKKKEEVDCDEVVASFQDQLANQYAMIDAARRVITELGQENAHYRTDIQFYAEDAQRTREQMRYLKAENDRLRNGLVKVQEQRVKDLTNRLDDLQNGGNPDGA